MIKQKMKIISQLHTIRLERGNTLKEMRKIRKVLGRFQEAGLDLKTNVIYKNRLGTMKRMNEHYFNVYLSCDK